MKAENQKIRVGIIGCGVIAPTHADGFRRQKGVELAWACDLARDKAQKLADAFGIPGVTTDYKQVMADKTVNCIAVCTDHASHVPITVAALKAGKHVLCEKALAASEEGLNSMFAEHARHPSLVFGGVFQHRFEPVNRCLKRMVEQGVFGTILTAGVQVRCLRTNEYYRVDKWRGSWSMAGGAVLINQAIHFVDILTWVMGGAVAVSGTYANLTHGEVMETEDTAAALLRFRSGALGVIEATCSSNLLWETTLLIHGTSGSVEMREGRPVKMAFADESRIAEVEAAVRESKNMIAARGAKDYYGFGHTLQIEDFIGSVREGRDPFVPAREARHAVDVVLGIYRSHRDGGSWIDVAKSG